MNGHPADPMKVRYAQRMGGAPDVCHLTRSGNVAICGRVVDVTLGFLPTGARVCGHCLRAEKAATR